MSINDYLGDGVYGVFDGHGIWLHANDLDDPSDRVYLEPSVVTAFERFIERCRAELDRTEDRPPTEQEQRAALELLSQAPQQELPSDFIDGVDQ
jgi:hypothetical protein